MMSDVKLSTYANLMSSLTAVKASASELAQGTRTHAEVHYAKLDAMRRERESNVAINSGIARATSQV
jgi:hypothetical protein